MGGGIGGRVGRGGAAKILSWHLSEAQSHFAHFLALPSSGILKHPRRLHFLHRSGVGEGVSTEVGTGVGGVCERVGVDIGGYVGCGVDGVIGGSVGVGAMVGTAVGITVGGGGAGSWGVGVGTGVAGDIVVGCGVCRCRWGTL